MGLIERLASQSPTKSAEKPATGPTFALSPERLRELGVFTCEGASQRQTLELRAVKRSLLKRIGRLHGRAAAAGRGRASNLVMTTSTRPGEGKTFTTLNLALSFALEDHQPVLLIDGDTMRPKVRGYLDLPVGDGLTECLADPSMDPREIAWRAESAPLTVLGEGRRHGGSIELLTGPDARRFFAKLSADWPDHLILIDAPPMLATTEAFALARYVDEVVFIVEADATPEPAVTVALDELVDVNPNTSLVLNRCLAPGGGSHYGSYEIYERTPSAPAEDTAVEQADAETARGRS